MDLQKILEVKIGCLPNGPYVDGLRAVNLHIQAATRHLLRGQKDADDSLFTDVIFRCNQAFEGSIKEAYRVIAGNDPQKRTPADIERFLAAGNILRKKVLDQFTRYRQEWRNPSTHDYTLDFDEDEALLAIVTVTVFAIVLCDQIDGKLAFDAAAAAAATTVLDKSKPLLELVEQQVLSFASTHETDENTVSDVPRLEGSLAGFLASRFSSIPEVKVEQRDGNSDEAGSIFVERTGEKVVVDLKRSRNNKVFDNVIEQFRLNHYINTHKISGGILMVHALGQHKYEALNLKQPGNGKLRVIAPVGK